MPSLPVSDHTPTSLPVATFGTIFLVSLRHENQPSHVWSSAPYCLSAMSSQVQQDYPSEVEVPPTTWSACPRISHMALSLGFFSARGQGALEGVGPPSTCRPEACRWGASPGDAEPVRQLRPLPEQCRSHPRMSRLKPWMPQWPPRSWGRTCPGPSGPACSGLCTPRHPSPWFPGEPLPRQGDGTQQEDDSLMSRPPGLGWPGITLQYN